MSQHDLVAKEVIVVAEPTVITTGTTSRVIENKFDGKLVSVDQDWVVVENPQGLSAVNKKKVITIIGPSGVSSKK